MPSKLKLNLNLIFLFLFTLTIYPSARGDESAAKAKWESAKALYAERTDPSKIEQALQLLETASSEAESVDLKYDVFLLWSEVLYWKGSHVSGDAEKIVLFESGRERADRAIKTADYADAYYWYASNLARWGEAKKFPHSLIKKDELMRYTRMLFNKQTRDGRDGGEFQGYGADRILGRVYFKLPPFAGGNLDTSLLHLARAFEEAPNYAINVHYYAESLFTKGEKDKAKKILDDMLAQDPNTFNPARIPETNDEFQEAKKFRTEMGN